MFKKYEPLIVLSIDPGFATTGLAWFHVKHSPAGFVGALRCLDGFGKLETSTVDSDSYRLQRVGLGLRETLEVIRPDLVYVEVPAYQGDYGNQPGRRKGTNKLYMAIGAIHSRLDGYRVVEVTPPREKKARRNELLEAGARTGRVELPTGPRGGARQNQYDAIWNGARAIEGRLGFP